MIEFTGTAAQKSFAKDIVTKYTAYLESISRNAKARLLRGEQENNQVVVKNSKRDIAEAAEGFSKLANLEKVSAKKIIEASEKVNQAIGNFNCYFIIDFSKI